MTVSAATFNTPFEALFDRTAALVPDVQVFNVGDGQTWTKPALALWCQIVLVGAGGDGSNGGGGGAGGGGGGGAGACEIWEGPASLLPSTLTVTVKDHCTSASVRSTSQVTGGNIHLDAESGLKGGSSGLDTGASGGNGAGPYQPTVAAFAVSTAVPTGGGAGASGQNALGRRFGGPGGGGGGDSGHAATGGSGGWGMGSQGGTGAASGGGGAGKGYGAGGGGGGGTAGGGGGGGGGYGTTAVAAAGGATTGGAGAAGICIITTWRGVAI